MFQLPTRAALVAFAVLPTLGLAQIPGEWKYTIATDLASVPVDMRVNFPTVSFAVCRTAADFASGRAFALQTLASSDARCESKNINIVAGGRGQASRVSLDYACDDGKTLAGRARAVVAPKRFVVALESSYRPAVSGVETIHQTMEARYVGDCKRAPDADEIKVQ